MSKYKKFLKQYFYIVTALSFFIFLFNLIVDPYGIFPFSPISLEKKPAAQVHVRLHKTYQVSRLHPQTIILGNSRAGTGLSPSHPSFTYLPVYNLGIDGGKMYELLRYFQHANRDHRLKEVVLALDFISFNNRIKHEPDFFEERLAKPDNIALHEPELIHVLFSSLALADSLKTLFHRFDPAMPATTTLGQLSPEGLEHYKAQLGGHRNTALHSEKGYLKTVYSAFQSSTLEDSCSPYHFLTQLIEECHKDNIRLILFISPAHARHQLLIETAHLWQEYETWIKQLVAINTQVALQMHKIPFDFWDFTDFTTFATEPFPKKNDAAYTMRWYWESSHYNSQLGDIILDTLYKKTPKKNQFGSLLTLDNVESHLVILRKEKENFKSLNPDIIAEITAHQLNDSIKELSYAI